MTEVASAASDRTVGTDLPRGAFVEGRWVTPCVAPVTDPRTARSWDAPLRTSAPLTAARGTCGSANCPIDDVHVMWLGIGRQMEPVAD
jgi:hypothetical protein